MERVQELFALRHRECVGIHVEITVAIHVVNVCPDILERNVVVAEIVHDLLEDRPVLVAPSTLMVAKLFLC